MTILRIVTDIEVKKYPGKEDRKKVEELVKDFAHGVITSSKLDPNDTCTYVTAHLHESTRRVACERCIENAQDERS